MLHSLTSINLFYFSYSKDLISSGGSKKITYKKYHKTRAAYHRSHSAVLGWLKCSEQWVKFTQWKYNFPSTPVRLILSHSAAPWENFNQFWFYRIFKSLWFSPAILWICFNNQKQILPFAFFSYLFTVSNIDFWNIYSAFSGADNSCTAWPILDIWGHCKYLHKINLQIKLLNQGMYRAGYSKVKYKLVSAGELTMQ